MVMVTYQKWYLALQLLDVVAGKGVGRFEEMLRCTVHAENEYPVP